MNARSMLCLLAVALGAVAARAQFAAPELEPNRGWLNTDRPLRFDDDLKGHVVLLDFWTYCCINCMHVLPDLEFLEEKYADQPFVVIGVHSAKFDNESTRDAIRQAVQRYDIHHPVVIDDQFGIWTSYGARGWPTFVVVDPTGTIVGATSGEGNRALLDRVVADTLAKAREAGTLADKKVEITPDAGVEPATGLWFPGKVLGVAPGSDFEGLLAIADSSNDRVIVAGWPDDEGRSTVRAIYGTGERGFDDGGPAGSETPAAFHDPQGMAFDGATGTLYVADTKNHAVRAIDLDAGTVTTLAGTGNQGYDRVGGASGIMQVLSSPWDLALSADRATLYVAMAGPHQIWQIDLATKKAMAIAGGAAENITDGRALEAHLAQPSGLALSTDGATLYFADSEVSAVRALKLDASAMERTVTTIIGTGLFDFGDVDGAYPEARLQHPLGVAVLPTDNGDRLLVADTYNDKVKLVDPDTRTSTTWLEPGLDEPGGLSLALGASGAPAALFVADTNNHRVLMIDPATRASTEIRLEGLRDPSSLREGAVPVTVGAAPDLPLTLEISPRLPDGAKPNPEAPASWRVLRLDDAGVHVLVQRTTREPALPIEIDLPPTPSGTTLRVELSMAYCFEDGALCLPLEGAWIVTTESGDSSRAVLELPIQ